MTECVERGGRQARRAWIKAHGPIPDGLYVCHSCDNPRCINLDHLWLGTAKENSQDMADKRRVRGGWHLDHHGEYEAPSGHIYGSAHPGAKLTENAVREIRASNEYQHVLAKRFGVSQATISSVRRYYTWRHVA